MLKWAFALITVVLGPGVSRAGLYNPAEPGEGELNPKFKDFQNTLVSLRFLGANKDEVKDPLQIRLFEKAMHEPMQMRYRMIQETAPRVIPADWNLAQRLSLSAYLIRRKKYLEAIELLKPLSRKEHDNFLILSNLSTAYHLAGQEPALAIDYLDQALKAWPEKWNGLDENRKKFLEQIGWDQTQFRNYREADTYQLKLLKLRRLEKAKAGKEEHPDDLFGVAFVSETGKYEAGKLAGNLPPRALAIVQQLLVWSPTDSRLYWLLGEIYNAIGEDAVALQIFEELAGFSGINYRPQMLSEHLNILRAVPRRPSVTVTPDIDSKPPPPTDSPSSGSFDVRSLLVGVLVGIIISIFAYWQIREIMRRRQGRTKV
jgi:tetratricopeptide (TPR) repeat protein